jgi:hypothetical protein
MLCVATKIDHEKDVLSIKKKKNVLWAAENLE